MKKYIVKAETIRDNSLIKLSESGINKIAPLMAVRKQIRELKGTWIISIEKWEDDKLLKTQFLER